MSKFKYKEAVFYIYIIIMFMPLQVTLVPHFITARMLGIEKSSLAIILPAIFNPFGVFLVRQYIKSIPKECNEAAMIDGAGHIRIMTHIVTPLIKPSIAALAILTFVDCWNMVEQVIIFIPEDYKRTLSVYLAEMGSKSIDLIFGASVLYLLPPLLMLLYGQEYFIEGIQLSGIK